MAAGTIYTVAEIAADPMALNSNLGAYTNFVNLLDLAAHAVPCGFQANGLPAGITLIAPAFTDHALARLGQSFQRQLDLPVGAVDERLAADASAASPAVRDGLIPLAVFGAHMRGLPLNHELTALGACFVATVRTSAAYRLIALGGTPERPGMLRVDAGDGAAVEGEIWALTPASFGTFVASVAAPLCIGTVELSDGRAVKGFLCESAATVGKRDITACGGWRSYLATKG